MFTSTTLSYIAAAGAALSAVGTIEQHSAAKKMAAARERQFKAEQERAEIQNMRNVRQQIRAQRATAGSIVARSATSGTLQSSGVMGGVGSTQSQMVGNLSYMSDIADTQTEAGLAQQQYGAAQGDLAMAQAYTALGSTIFSQAGGFKAFGEAPPTNYAPVVAATVKPI